MKKLMMFAALFASLTLGACVDNEESASVTAVRNAYAEQLKSIATLNNAKAQAEALIAAADAAMTQALAEAQKIENDLARAEAQAEIEKLQAQLELDLLEIQTNILKQQAKLYKQAENASFEVQGLVIEYGIVSGKLQTALKALANAEAQLASYEANGQASWESDVAYYEGEYNAAYEDYLEAYNYWMAIEDYIDATSGELDAAFAAANAEALAANTELTSINQELMADQYAEAELRQALADSDYTAVAKSFLVDEDKNFNAGISEGTGADAGWYMWNDGKKKHRVISKAIFDKTPSLSITVNDSETIAVINGVKAPYKSYYAVDEAGLNAWAAAAGTTTDQTNALAAAEAAVEAFQPVYDAAKAWFDQTQVVAEANKALDKAKAAETKADDALEQAEKEFFAVAAAPMIYDEETDGTNKSISSDDTYYEDQKVLIDEDGNILSYYWDKYEVSQDYKKTELYKAVYVLYGGTSSGLYLDLRKANAAYLKAVEAYEAAVEAYDENDSAANKTKMEAAEKAMDKAEDAVDELEAAIEAAEARVALILEKAASAEAVMEAAAEAAIEAAEATEAAEEAVEEAEAEIPALVDAFELAYFAWANVSYKNIDDIAKVWKKDSKNTTTDAQGAINEYSNYLAATLKAAQNSISGIAGSEAMFASRAAVVAYLLDRTVIDALVTEYNTAVAELNESLVAQAEALFEVEAAEKAIIAIKQIIASQYTDPTQPNDYIKGLGLTIEVGGQMVLVESLYQLQYYAYSEFMDAKTELKNAETVYYNCLIGEAPEVTLDMLEAAVANAEFAVAAAEAQLAILEAALATAMAE